MTVKEWVASHTGLPSFYSDAPVRIVAGDGRILADGSGAVLLSDALAVPGMPTVYTVGPDSFTLTRASFDARGALLTDVNGRAVPGLVAVNNEDPVDWKSSASFQGGVTRWALREPHATGRLECILLNPSLEEACWHVLKRRGHVIVGAGSATAGVLLRLVTVNQVSRTRPGAHGELRFEVSWTEASARDLARASSGAAPLLTWGEWEAYRARTGDMADHSLLELARLIAGMPV